MNPWIQNDVTLALTVEGAALCSDLPEEEVLKTVFVEAANDLGLWVVVDRPALNKVTLRLIRWQHFESAQVEVVTAPPKIPGKVIGFKR